MNPIEQLWQSLPVRHRWILSGLVVLALLLLMLKSCSNEGTTQLQAPPLPLAPAAIEPSSSGQIGTTQSAADLRLAERRPLLTQPGLEFADQPQRRVERVAQPAPEPPAKSAVAKLPATKSAPNSATATATPQAMPKVKPSRQQLLINNDKKLFAALPDDAWLLQVAAAPNEAEAKRRCQDLSLPCVSYTAKRQGRRVWILVVGPYSSRDAALAAVAKLPASLQAQGPFARQVATVRQDANG